MAYDELLAERVRASLRGHDAPFVEKRMMGGLCFMVDGKMCVGVETERLMVRIDPAGYDVALTRPGCAPMDFTGKPMRGFVFVSGVELESREALDSWIELALEFNPRAAASRRSASVKAKGRSRASRATTTHRSNEKRRKP